VPQLPVPSRAPALLERTNALAALWQAAWVAAIALTGLGLAAAGQLHVGQETAAMTLGAAPAALALAVAMLSRPAETDAPMLVAWAICGALASLLTGGAGGPLGAWCLAPLAAAAFMGSAQRLALAGALSLAAGGISTLSAALLSVPPPPGPLSTALGLLALATVSGGLAAAFIRLGGGAARGEEARRRFGELVANQPLLLMGVTHDGYVDSAIGRMPDGSAAGALAGRRLIEAAAPQDRPALEAAILRAFREGSGQVGFTPAGDPDGWAIAALRARSGTRLVAAVIDGGSQRAREAALERARETAESQNAGKSRFLANMSHELRTPLNAIMGFSDIMRQRLFGPLSDRYAEYAELMHESGGHLLELINDILDMSKIEAERYDLALEDFDLREAVAAVLRLIRGQADRAGVQLRGVLPKEALEGRADRRAIKQIVLNLVSNALKFTPKDGQVTVTARAAGETLEIIVADTGVGISAEDIVRLGNPYEQAGDAEQKAGGTGLGLSLVRAFAKLHGGDMTIESELGLGATVTVRLPVLKGAAASAPAEQAASGG
jgi:cell cycle sensor histidine kinase DivJ